MFQLLVWQNSNGEPVTEFKHHLFDVRKSYLTTKLLCLLTVLKRANSLFLLHFLQKWRIKLVEHIDKSGAPDSCYLLTFRLGYILSTVALERKKKFHFQMRKKK